MMERFRVAIILAAALTVTCLAQSTRPTTDVECSELNPGQTVQYKTDAISNSGSTVRAYATVEVKRDVTDKNAESCLARYKLFVAQGREPFTAVKAFSDRSEWMVGAQMIGFSKHETKLAADFWWAGGDYTGHRPAIYDVTTKRVQFRELGEQITGQLPSCDYFQNFTGVTNSGEAVIHVPKSQYVEEGCPDQGDWLFDVASGKVRRAAAVSRVRESPPPFNVQPLRTGAPLLTTAQIRTTLGKDFRVVHRVSQIPPVVRDSFSLLTNEPFQMVNPGQEMSTDMILPGVPRKRLVFAGMTDDAAVLVYQQGGYVGTLHAAVFSYTNRSGMWGAMLEDYSVHDLATLRSAVKKGQFKTWKR